MKQLKISAILIVLSITFFLNGTVQKLKKMPVRGLKLPDLTVSIAKPPTNLHITKKSFKIPDVFVRNIGKVKASKIDVDLFISKRKLTITDSMKSRFPFRRYVWRTREHIAFLGAGLSKKVVLNRPVKLPEIPPGKYFFGAAVDPKDLIPEKNEKNNSASIIFELPPFYRIRISSLSQTFFFSSGSGFVELNIRGTGFGSSIGTKSIRVGPISLNRQIELWSPAWVIMPLPYTLELGKLYKVYFEQGGTRISNIRSIFLLMDVTEVWPVSGPSGSTIGIIGQGFGDTQGTKNVNFGGTYAAVSRWRNTTIDFTVPNLPNGSYEIYIERGGTPISIKRVSFTVTN